MMKLYYSDVLAPRKVCALARYLKSPIEYVYLDLQKGQHKKPAYLEINPNGRVPTLVDGDKVLWEADAILCLLSDRAAAGLWPHDERQFEVISWFSWNSQHFIRAGGALYFEFVIKARFGMGPPDKTAVEESVRAFRTCADVLNNHLKGRKWLLGETLSVADFSVAVPLPWAREASMPLDDYAEVRRWHDQLNEFEAWRDPFPNAAASPGG
jgi:glutathione S-transferase